MNKIENWEKTRLLEGLGESFKEKIAGWLQQQLEFNRCHDDKQFLKLSIPLVRRVYANLDTHKITEVIPGSGEDFCEFKVDGELLFDVHQCNLDVEVNRVAEFASKMKEQLDKHLQMELYQAKQSGKDFHKIQLSHIYPDGNSVKVFYKLI